MLLNPHPWARVSPQVPEGRALQAENWRQGEEGTWGREIARFWQNWLHHSANTLLLVEEKQIQAAERVWLA